MKNILLLLIFTLGGGFAAFGLNAKQPESNSWEIDTPSNQTLTHQENQKPAEDEESKAKQKLQPVAIVENTASLEPTNTRVEFVGTHVGSDPKPRLGGFEQFKGEIKVDSDTKTIDSIKATFDTTSIWTEFKALTVHLKAPDFFDTEQFKEASFESTSIAFDDEENIFKVTGDFTMLGNTAEIMFPATVEFSDDGITLASEFEIDRTDFGMDKMTQGVEKTVTIKVVVGLKTEPKKSK